MDPKTPKRRAVQYQRVSTQDQNPQLQADETYELIQRRDWELIDSYVDHGVSGSKGKDKRPELRRLLADARRRRFDILVVWRSDRLFRSMKEMVNVIEELAALGVEFVSATEPMDTTTPQGKLLLHLVSAFGEFERNVLIERTRAGLAAARRRGVRIGRPKKYVDVGRALDLRRQGWSLRKIAAKLGVGASTLCRALQDADGAEVDTADAPSNSCEAVATAG